MAVTIKNITFNRVPKKKSKGLGVSMELTLTGIPQDLTVALYLLSLNFYKLIHALDIDWDGIDLGNGVVINDTSDLINWILSLFAGMELGETIAEYVNRVALTVNNVPLNSIGTEQIENGAVRLEDLNEEVKNKMESNYYDDDESLWIEGGKREELNG